MQYLKANLQIRSLVERDFIHLICPCEGSTIDTGIVGDRVAGSNGCLIGEILTARDRYGLLAEISGRTGRINGPTVQIEILIIVGRRGIAHY